MKTLGQLIEEGSEGGSNRSTIAQIAASAYWAGQSDMRGAITRKAARQLQSLPQGRYRHLQEAAARHVLRISEINPSVLACPDGCLADDGSGEAAEIKSWDFDV